MLFRSLLLDEPTSGLDDGEIEQLGGIIHELRETGRTGVLLVEHHIPFVMDLADQMTVLDLGKVLASGTPDDVRSSKLVQDAYLG